MKVTRYGDRCEVTAEEHQAARKSTGTKTGKAASQRLEISAPASCGDPIEVCGHQLVCECLPPECGADGGK
jgi:hypothetical protein